MKKIENNVAVFYFLCTVAIMGFSSCRSTSKVNNTTDRKANILLLMVDDLRPELGSYGSDHIKTPNIDKLASESVLFDNAYAQYPVCGPSRLSLLTGLRTTGNAWRTDNLQQSFVSLPKYFRNNSYYTVSMGKVFHHMNDRQQDWSESPWRSEAIYHGEEDWAHYNTYNQWQDEDSEKYVNPQSGRGPYFEAADVSDNAYQDGKLAQNAVNKLKELKNKDKPFLLSLGFWRPHLPLNAPKKYWDKYKRTKIELANNRFRPKNLPDEVTNSREILRYGVTDGWPAHVNFHKRTRHAYYASVSYVDQQIGKVLKALNNLDLSKNTIVVLLGDHGWHLGEHNFWGKHNLLNNSTQVPLIIKAPGFTSGSVSKTVELLDIYPTLTDLTGLRQPGHLDGKSLLALMKDKQTVAKWDKDAFSIWRNARNIITEQYSYTEWINSDSKMLFDHQSDPQENHNVVDKPEYQDIVDSLSSRLHRKFKEEFVK